ncbi:DUF3515 family protein [Nocardia cerradoensis]|uniref:DUF3515 family protein n=1 Tax=Nocardia cerradoensis TaxID=85688 RepID=UPI0002D75A87|nr:DUF3515 family protein [Nocardia cerradoensis]NKY45356.1 DUF3515 family protein [Nocardia cerradoensis]
MSSETDRPTAGTPQPDRPESEPGLPAAAAPESATDRPENSAPTVAETPASPGADETDSSDRADADAAAESSGSQPADSEPTERSDSEPTERGDSDGAPAAEQASADDAGPQLHPALIATAVALPVALIVVVLVIAAMSRQSAGREPLALGSVPAPAAPSQDCTTLLAALPESLGDDYTKSELAQPAPPATAAWQLPGGGDPIVLRCGLDRPLEFTKASALQVVNGVNWFEVRDQTSGVTSGTWYAVDRGTYIAVTMPTKAGPSPLQEMSNTIGKSLPAKPLDPGPVPN